MSLPDDTAMRRVLIVDDEPANIHNLAEALGDGFDVRFATDATRALDLARSFAFDLILLDVVMPDIDGFETLRRLKADAATHSVPVIFVTSMDEVADEERGFALGAVDYITKPVSAPLVRARVRTHIELKRQRDLLERRALVDELTGIANRRRFEEVFEARWRTALDDGSALLLAVIDVDHFKEYNDCYGHGAGDECLRRIAGAMAAAFPRGDQLAARIGGEEFALLLPGNDGKAQIERLLQAVRALRIPHAPAAGRDRISISAGAIRTIPTTAESTHALAEAADRLLYEAKRAGRNRGEYDDRVDDSRMSILPESRNDATP